MADLSKKKSDALSALVAVSPRAMLLASQVAEFVAYVTDNGFLSGGASPIVDADCQGENAHLDAATFNAAVTAIATLALSTQNRTTLRKASRTPIPGN